MILRGEGEVLMEQHMHQGQCRWFVMIGASGAALVDLVGHADSAWASVEIALDIIK